MAISSFAFELVFMLSKILPRKIMIIKATSGFTLIINILKLCLGIWRVQSFEKPLHKINHAVELPRY